MRPEVSPATDCADAPVAGCWSSAAPRWVTHSERWAPDEESLSRTMEQPIPCQLRRGRFEFTPAGFRPREPAEAPLTGPDLFAQREAEVDLSRLAGPLELRVWVYVERAYSPGLRRSTWTRARTTRTRIVPAEDEEALPSRYWTPVHRDQAYERRLLGAVQSALAQRQRSATSSDLPDDETVAATKR